jgi:hypothetical protein
MSSVDKSRKNLIDSLNADQKDIFLIGMCYYSAYLSKQEQLAGKSLSLVEKYELSSVIEALNRQGINTEINT